MKKSKKVVLGLVAAGVIGSMAALTFGFTAPNGKVHYDLSVKQSTTMLGQAFQKASNLKADQDLLGFTPSQGKATLELHVDLTPVKNNTGNNQKGQISGSGVLHIGSANFPFSVDSNSMVNQTTLSDGRTFVWGPINGSLKDKNGVDRHVAIGLVYLPESGQEKVTCTVGTFEDGLAAVAFGDQFTVTDEMKNLMTKKTK